MGEHLQQLRRRLRVLQQLLLLRRRQDGGDHRPGSRQPQDLPPHQALQVESPRRRHLLGNAQVQSEQGGGGRDPGVQRAHEAHLGRAGGRREGQGQQGGDGETRKAVPLRFTSQVSLQRIPTPNYMQQQQLLIRFSPRLDIVYYVV